MPTPQQALQQSLDLLQELEALRPLTSEQEQRIWQKFRLDWNYHSNHLEGNSLTYGETKSLLLHNITAQGKPLKDHLEITGHNEAIAEIQDAVKRELPLTESFLRSLHTLILKERYQVDAQTPDGQPAKKWVEVGQYKTQPNHVLTVTGETFRFAEPFEVAAKMHALVQQAQERKATATEGLLLAAKLHYEFVLIHPFDDGNGRMARLLMNLVLMQYGFPPAIIKTDAKEAYFAALRQADGGQFEVFAQYIAERVSESLRIMIAGAKGEDISEPDDLDKKIALFKQTLLTAEGGSLASPPDREALQYWLHKILLPLAEDFFAMAKKFEEFYVSSRLLLQVNHNNLEGSLDSIRQSLLLIKPDKLETVYCQVNFTGLRINGLDDSEGSYTSYFRIKPATVSYSIEASGHSAQSYRYDQHPSKQEVRKLLETSADLHLQFIESKRKK